MYKGGGDNNGANSMVMVNGSYIVDNLTPSDVITKIM